MVAVVCVVGALCLVAIGFTLVELRSITPLAFRCLHCGADFQQAPHRDFPRECPACHARDWANDRRAE